MHLLEGQEATVATTHHGLMAMVSLQPEFFVYDRWWDAWIGLYPAPRKVVVNIKQAASKMVVAQRLIMLLQRRSFEIKAG